MRNTKLRHPPHLRPQPSRPKIIRGTKQSGLVTTEKDRPAWATKYTYPDPDGSAKPSSHRLRDLQQIGHEELMEKSEESRRSFSGKPKRKGKAKAKPKPKAKI